MIINAVIFDLDGTLLNTLEDLTESTNFALSAFGYSIKTVSEVNSYVGNGVAKLIERAIPEGKNNKDFEPCLNMFKYHYSNNMQNLTKPYEGIVELLKSLKERGIKTAVVSNKFDAAVKGLTEKYFKGLIDISIGENEAEGISKKPAPDMVIKAIEELKTDRASVIYVGDSDTDILTAKNTGISCVSVSWGFRTKEFLKQNGASTIIDTPSELLNLL